VAVSTVIDGVGRVVVSDSVVATIWNTTQGRQWLEAVLLDWASRQSWRAAIAVPEELRCWPVEQIVVLCDAQTGVVHCCDDQHTWARPTARSTTRMG
jgi:hypothetical protein